MGIQKYSESLSIGVANSLISSDFGYSLTGTGMEDMDCLQDLEVHDGNFPEKCIRNPQKLMFRTCRILFQQQIFVFTLCLSHVFIFFPSFHIFPHQFPVLAIFGPLNIR